MTTATRSPAAARLRGLAALILLAALIVGIPAALLAVAGNPLPAGLPGWQQLRLALTTPDDGSLFLGLLLVIGWAGWATFTLSALLETAALLRGRPTPRLPALGVQQRTAAGLIAAAAVLFTTPLAATAATHLPATVPVTATLTAAGSQPATDSRVPGASTYTVRPGDSLRSIAEQHLGDGAHYRQIAALNTRQHPTLQHTDEIQPGWRLQLPTPPSAHPTTPARPVRAGSYRVHPGDNLWDIAEQNLGDGARYRDIATASRSTVQPDGGHLTDPDTIRTGWTLTIPDRPHPPAPPAHPAQSGNRPDQPAPLGTAPPAPADTATRPAQQPPVSDHAAGTATHSTLEADHEHDGFPVRTAAGVGAVLAAGVLTLIATRRATQQRRRRPGQPLPLPTGAAATAEQELRSTADPLTVSTVDTALRGLAAHCHHQRRPLPIVRAARLTADQFDLYLAEPADLPAPWTGTADTAVWTLPADIDPADLPATDPELPAPYPSLVTIGHDEEDGHVFLDLEFLAALGITGNSDHTREVLAALAVELATSCWADDLQVTIVGAYPELEDALGTGRVRYLPTAARLLEDLTRRADQDHAALAAADTPDLPHARAAGTTPELWTPEIVLLASEIPDSQRDQLTALVHRVPRVAVAAVTTGTPIGEWRVAVDEDSGVLEPLGLRIRPQRLLDSSYHHVLEVLASTDPAPSAPENAGLDEPAEPALADLTDLPAVPTAAAPVDVDPAPSAPLPPAAAAPEKLQAAAAPAPTATGPTALSGLVDAAAATDGDRQHDTTADRAVDDTVHPAATTTGPSGSVPLDTTAAAGPRILFLGPVEVTGATGQIESSKRKRYTELPAFLALNPGVQHGAVDAAMWPGVRVGANTRNTAMSKVRKWFGREHLPVYRSETGYRLGPAVSTDWAEWCELLPRGAGQASTEALQQALALVRGRPFDGVHPRRYAWAEPHRQTMIAAIVDAAYELGRRRLMDGRWQAAEQAAVTGLSIEPGLERLWRLRILAAHASGNQAAENEAIARLLAITDDLGGDLEPETEQLLHDLRDPTTPSQRPRDLAAHAL